MERISWFIEDLRDEQEKQRIIPAPYTIRNRVEGTMDKLEYDIARLRYGAAYHSGEFNIDRISPDVWDDMKMAESDMLLIFADIMWDVQWLVRFFGILKGKNINVVTACASGTNSIGEAMRAIQHGEAEVMVAGGTESCITPLGVAGFSGLTALSTSEDPERASIPFDLERNGFVMGEGAGVVVLEELEHAKARGAKIYAELAGYGATGDAYHITSPAEDGSGAAKAMEYAIADAGMTPEDIDYINAHGTATHHNDLFETKAIKLALGDHAYKVKINSTKSMIGHLLGAAGGVEFIDCVKSIQDGFVHATAGLKVDDPECDLDYTKGDGVSMEVKTVLTNSLGFGGHNACLLVRRFEE